LRNRSKRVKDDQLSVLEPTHLCVVLSTQQFSDDPQDEKESYQAVVFIENGTFVTGFLESAKVNLPNVCVVGGCVEKTKNLAPYLER
jgi:hypothetical protein